MKIHEINIHEKDVTLRLNAKKTELKKNINLHNDYDLINLEQLNFNSKIVKRGKNESTIYIKVPKELKKFIKFKKTDTFKECKIDKINNTSFVVTFSK